jgi:hypothetical protein
LEKIKKEDFWIGGSRLNEEQIREAFEESGYPVLGKALGFKLWLSGEMDLSSLEENPLELLLEASSFNDGEPLAFDSFLFQLRQFRSVCERNCLPIGYWQ